MLVNKCLKSLHVNKQVTNIYVLIGNVHNGGLCQLSMYYSNTSDYLLGLLFFAHKIIPYKDS